MYIEGTGSHKDDTVTHPGHYAVCPWSDTLKLVSVGDPGKKVTIHVLLKFADDYVYLDFIYVNILN